MRFRHRTRLIAIVLGVVAVLTAATAALLLLGNDAPSSNGRDPSTSATRRRAAGPAQECVDAVVAWLDVIVPNSVNDLGTTYLTQARDSLGLHSPEFRILTESYREIVNDPSYDYYAHRETIRAHLPGIEFACQAAYLQGRRGNPGRSDPPSHGAADTPEEAAESLFDAWQRGTPADSADVATNEAILQISQVPPSGFWLGECQTSTSPGSDYTCTLLFKGINGGTMFIEQVDGGYQVTGVGFPAGP
jgi:hypothetical protein